MEPTTLAAIAALGAMAGLLIGCIGIGGVILVPMLHYAGGIPIHTAIGGAMLAYLVSGAVGTLVFGGKGTIRWEMAPRVWAGAVPGALAGALASSAAPGAVLELAIGTLAILSGAHALLQRGGPGPAAGPQGAVADSRALSDPTLMLVGAITGFGSALTGTGGPLLLIPLLMWLQVPVLTAIGLSQAIQLPIALVATVGNGATGTLDLALGALLGIGLLFGTWGGAHLAHALPRDMLQRTVAVVLVAVGLLIVAKIMARLSG